MFYLFGVIDEQALK